MDLARVRQQRELYTTYFHLAPRVSIANPEEAAKELVIHQARISTIQGLDETLNEFYERHLLERKAAEQESRKDLVRFYEQNPSEMQRGPVFEIGQVGFLTRLFDTTECPELELLHHQDSKNDQETDHEFFQRYEDDLEAYIEDLTTP